jgi:hypothetical protein
VDQVDKIIDLAETQLGTKLLTFWLRNYEGDCMRFSQVRSVEEGRAMWRKVGAEGWDLEGFELRDGEKIVYSGTYVTDEC